MIISLKTKLSEFFICENRFNLKPNKYVLMQELVIDNEDITIKDLVDCIILDESKDPYYGPTQIINYLYHRGLLHLEVVEYKSNGIVIKPEVLEEVEEVGFRYGLNKKEVWFIYLLISGILFYHFIIKGNLNILM